MKHCPHCHRPLSETPHHHGKGGPYRIDEGRKLLGVCGGVADYFAWSRVWVRVATVLLCFFAFPMTIFVYFIAALIMEHAPYQEPEYQHAVD